MDLRELQYITAVAEHRNFTKAAESLYISQSALSHFIRKTEEELGVRLFDRSTVPISLTYAGQRYTEAARKILLENDSLMKELREISRQMVGVIHLGISRDRASYMAPLLIREFQRQYPGIQVQIYTEGAKNLREALKCGRIDLLLLPADGREEDAAFASQTIYQEELVLCAEKGRITGEKKLPGTRQAVNLSALTDLPFFLLPKDRAIRTFCDRFFKAHALTPSIRGELDSSITCYRMAAAGLGYAIVPYMTTRLAAPGMDAELFSLDAAPVTWDVCMYYRKEAFLSHPELDMIRLAQTLFRRELLSVGT